MTKRNHNHSSQSNNNTSVSLQPPINNIFFFFPCRSKCVPYKVLHISTQRVASQVGQHNEGNHTFAGRSFEDAFGGFGQCMVREKFWGSSCVWENRTHWWQSRQVNTFTYGLNPVSLPDKNVHLEFVHFFPWINIDSANLLYKSVIGTRMSYKPWRRVF